MSLARWQFAHTQLRLPLRSASACTDLARHHGAHAQFWVSPFGFDSHSVSVENVSVCCCIELEAEVRFRVSRSWVGGMRGFVTVREVGA